MSLVFKGQQYQYWVRQEELRTNSLVAGRIKKFQQLAGENSREMLR